MASLTTARSGSVSPLKSPLPQPTAAWCPRRRSSPRRRLAPAPPSSTETLLELWLTTARSGSESPLKLPVTTDCGLLPTAMLVGPVKFTACATPGTQARTVMGTTTSSRRTRPWIRPLHLSIPAGTIPDPRRSACLPAVAPDHRRADPNRESTAVSMSRGSAARSHSHRGAHGDRRPAVAARQHDACAQRACGRGSRKLASDRLSRRARATVHQPKRSRSLSCSETLAPGFRGSTCTRRRRPDSRAATSLRSETSTLHRWTRVRPRDGAVDGTRRRPHGRREAHRTAPASWSRAGSRCRCPARS